MLVLRIMRDAPCNHGMASADDTGTTRAEALKLKAGRDRVLAGCPNSPGPDTSSLSLHMRYSIHSDVTHAILAGTYVRSTPLFGPYAYIYRRIISIQASSILCGEAFSVFRPFTEYTFNVLMTDGSYFIQVLTSEAPRNST
jgi:hypothetical protein